MVSVPPCAQRYQAYTLYTICSVRVCLDVIVSGLGSISSGCIDFCKNAGKLFIMCSKRLDGGNAIVMTACVPIVLRGLQMISGNFQTDAVEDISDLGSNEVAAVHRWRAFFADHKVGQPAPAVSGGDSFDTQGAHACMGAAAAFAFRLQYSQRPCQCSKRNGPLTPYWLS